MANGDTKTNQYLDIAANGNRNDFPASCCETRSQTLIREVGERIMDLEDEVHELENNPDVVDIVATYADLQAYDTTSLTDKDIIRVLQDETHDGESTYYRYNKQSNTWTYIGESKQYDDFVGTDGTTAGEAGLVPAPATTDAGKFLSASGLWEEVAAGGSGITELTTADYNYPTDNPQYVAMWLKDDGIYYAPNGVNAKTYRDDTMGNRGGIMLVREENSLKYITRVQATTISNNIGHYAMTAVCVTNAGTSVGTEAHTVMTGDSINNLTSNESRMPLAAAQGKVLKDMIDALPTGGVTELTTADYNYPTDNPNRVALWLLDEGTYSAGTGVFVASSTGNNIEWGPGLFTVGKPFVDNNYTFVQIDGVGYNVQTGKWVHFSENTRKDNGATVGTGVFTPPTVVQTTGTSTSSVMSQSAVTSMVFADPSTRTRVKIGGNATNADFGVAIGYGANVTSNGTGGVALGNAKADQQGAVAIGYGANASSVGQVDIGANTQGALGYGYNSSNYRLLTGLYDGQSAHDGVTVGQVNSVIDAINTALSTNIPHIGA